MIKFQLARYESLYDVYVPIAAIATIMVGKDHVIVKTLDDQSYVVDMSAAAEILDFLSLNPETKARR